ncbi:MAG TPA: serine/threonine-protein kinase [Isosphaeraceae bacterium]
MIPCPQCRRGLKVDEQQTRPGRYRLQCPRCSARLQLVVPTDPEQPPTLAPRDAGATAPAPPGPPSSPIPTGTTVGAPEGQGPPPEDSAAEPDAPAPPSSPGGVPVLLGGYQILGELGRGGMGAVYLARQLSLDRPVALKVMRPEWARDPRFVARFTREAYAAAQLVHHNVVQIYDFGQDRGTSYFSMEFVPGRTLSRLIRDEGKLDPEVAVGYVLQAARGLKFAHDRGMIHRDVKPDNLMVNDQGIVKVADLGLVKTPGAGGDGDGAEPPSELLKGRVPVQGSLAAQEAAARKAAAHDTPGVTRARTTLGTPAYMPPEQAVDAAAVDHRADIYALGCTLYALVTGRPPFQGTTIVELITKHATEPVVPPELVVKRVPKALSAIILKMVAKKPEDRYADLGEVIRDLEDVLGVPGAGPFTPREEHAEALEASVAEFRAAPLARLRVRILMGFFGSCALLAVLGLLARRPLLAGGFVGFGALAALAYLVVDGIARAGYLFGKVRALVFGGGLADWLTLLAVLVLLAVLLVASGLLGVFLACAGAAALLAVGVHILVDRRLDAQRRAPVERVAGLLKAQRRRGLEEDALRQFVCKYSGPDWEEFYEALFGYEAKLLARRRWGLGEGGRPRPRRGVWREPIVAWLDARQAARRVARETRLLEAIEAKNLQAQGVNLLTARRKARRAAEAIVSKAAEQKQEARRETPTAAPEDVRQRRSAARALDAAAERPEDVLVHVEAGRRDRWHLGGLPARLLGPRARLLAGALLLAGCLAWMHQNRLISGREITDLATQAIETRDITQAQKALQSKVATLQRVATRTTRPLALPLLPARVAGLFRGFNPGVAGLILVASAFFRGWRLGLFVVPAAALAVLGPTAGLPPIAVPLWGTIRPSESSLALSLVLAGLGVVFGRSRA